MLDTCPHAIFKLQSNWVMILRCFVFLAAPLLLVVLVRVCILCILHAPYLFGGTPLHVVSIYLRWRIVESQANLAWRPKSQTISRGMVAARNKTAAIERTEKLRQRFQSVLKGDTCLVEFGKYKQNVTSMKVLDICMRMFRTFESRGWNRHAEYIINHGILEELPDAFNFQPAGFVQQT